MASKQSFILYVHPYPRYITGRDTHDLCVVCLGVEDAHCELRAQRQSKSRRSQLDLIEGLEKDLALTLPSPARFSAFS